jgi:hypothetical protein
MVGAVSGHAAIPPSIEDFASRPLIEGVSISPDGRYLATIRTRDGRGFAFISDRRAGKDQTMRLVITEPPLSPIDDHSPRATLCNLLNL